MSKPVFRGNITNNAAEQSAAQVITASCMPWSPLSKVMCDEALSIHGDAPHHGEYDEAVLRARSYVHLALGTVKQCAPHLPRRRARHRDAAHCGASPVTIGRLNMTSTSPTSTNSTIAAMISDFHKLGFGSEEGLMSVISLTRFHFLCAGACQLILPELA